MISARLGQDDTVGILVERILSTKHVHGRTVFVLKPVGKVPLGAQRSGHLRIRWNLKVNGHRLGRGKYLILITLRAFNRSRTVLLGTTNPVVFTFKQLSADAPVEAASLHGPRVSSRHRRRPARVHVSCGRRASAPCRRSHSRSW